MNFTFLKYKYWLLPFLLVLGSLSNTFAQSADQEKYLAEPLQERKITSSAWDKATGELDFSPTKKKSKKERERRERDESTRTSSPSTFNGNGSIFNGDWGGIFKILFFSIVIGALMFLIIRMLGGNTFKSNNAINRKEIGYSMAEIEENLHEADLEGFAQHALDKDDYKLAIRLYYLQILKVLSQDKKIKWKRDKTNNQYIREMASHPQFKAFGSITRQFERVWYGDVEVKKREFEKLQPSFSSFLKKIS
jgi:hypothetical protein